MKKWQVFSWHFIYHKFLLATDGKSEKVSLWEDVGLSESTFPSGMHKAQL